ncbi:MAG: DUF4416 family protein [Desulfohalobiaceae bacterium]|nr:DUF4416 family protein [Desulfohalobiaceae bacterium]
MSNPRIPFPAQLMLSVLCGRGQDFYRELFEPLTRKLGLVDFVSEALAFTETDYYDQELGPPITRRILGFAPLFSQDELVRIKLLTNDLEDRFSRPDGSRTFNLDPGLITLERLVLASGKNFSHRLYLGQGIWGDLTLIYQKKAWQVLPWTFRDYAGEDLQRILTAMRNRYKEKLEAL